MRTEPEISREIVTRAGVKYPERDFAATRARARAEGRPLHCTFRNRGALIARSSREVRVF